MKTVWTPEGSTNSVIQLSSLGDPAGVGSSNDGMNCCPQVPTRGYRWLAPAGLGNCAEQGTAFALRCPWFNRKNLRVPTQAGAGIILRILSQGTRVRGPAIRWT
jgi:hypothetical protein